jgi:PST family polysaccharide transporter
MLVTTTLSVYYLPKLSELQDPADIKKEIWQGYKIILPVTATCGLIIYLLRDFIIRVLFTAEFVEMEVLFGWQMVGDALKIGSWIIAYLMVSKAKVKMFIITELLFSVLLYLLVSYFSHEYGLLGVSIAYALNYFLYWVFVSLLIFLSGVV